MTTPGKPVFGAGALRYPQIMSPNFNLANPSASPANSWALLQNGLAYIFGLVLSGGTITGPDYIINTSGIFIYSGTPANGNLIGSWAGVAGTDAFGNAYPQGFNITKGSISGTTFTGTDFLINTAGAFFYNAAPALGNLIASIARASGTDAKGNVFYQGLCSYEASGGANPTLVSQLFNGVLSFGPNSSFDGSLATSPSQVSQNNLGDLVLISGTDSITDTVNSLHILSSDASNSGGFGNFPNIVFDSAFTLFNIVNPSVSAGPVFYADSTSDEPSVINSSGFIGLISVVGRDWDNSGTVNSAAFGNILSVAVASGKTYKFDMMLFLAAAHSAGQWQIQVAGPTFSLLDYNFKWTSGAGVTGLNVARNTLSATQSGPNPSVAGPYWVEIHGFITTTAAGHIVIKAASSTGATDTWTYNISSFLEVKEIA